MKFQLHTQMHMSMEKAHILVEKCDRYGFLRQTDTPVIGGYYFAKKFGKPVRWYKFDDSKQWLNPQEFAIALLQRLGEPWQEYQSRLAIAKKSRRRWRRNRNRDWLNPLKFVSALKDVEDAA